MSSLDRLATVGIAAFGAAMIIFSAIVSFETVSRKFLNMSLQGVDELGGYVLAVTSSLAFTLALLDRAHIRIDLVHGFLPRVLQRILNLFSSVTLAAVGILFAYVAWQMVSETIEFHSTAPTPWATPLIYPQSVWLAALALFAFAATGGAIRAVQLALAGRWREFERSFGPKGTEEEIREELADIERR
jgi:TRAP-type C4-dicarboxylate transport system permease small subunit